MIVLHNSPNTNSASDRAYDVSRDFRQIADKRALHSDKTGPTTCFSVLEIHATDSACTGCTAKMAAAKNAREFSACVRSSTRGKHPAHASANSQGGSPACYRRINATGAKTNCARADSIAELRHTNQIRDNPCSDRSASRGTWLSSSHKKLPLKAGQYTISTRPISNSQPPTTVSKLDCSAPGASFADLT